MSSSSSGKKTPNELIQAIERFRACENPYIADENFVNHLIHLLEESNMRSKNTFSANIDDIIKIMKYLNITFSKTNQDIDVQQCKLQSTIQKACTDIDAELQILVEEYSAILSDEIDTSKQRLSRDKDIAVSAEKQAKVIRDMKLFALNLSFDSQKRISCSFLDCNSSQFSKCEKAFLENIHPNLRQDTANHFQVFSICKLEHMHLSKTLQKSVSLVSPESSKVKGVFCMLPFDFLKHFAAYGLYLQETNHSNMKQDVPNWLRNPWHMDYKSSSTSISSNEDLLQDILTLTSNHFLTFANYSTPQSMSSLDDLGHDGIVCIALCRVLINNAMIVSSNIVDDDVDIARRELKDVVYCNKTGEYCFTNPEHVLPEFFMFVHVHNTENKLNVPPKNDRKDNLLRKQAIISSIHDLFKTTTKNLVDELKSQIVELHTSQFSQEK